MKTKTIIFTCCMLLSTMMQATNCYNVRDFGATGNGKTIDSPAINKAIEAASKAGGGTIFFPAGIYASYSIHLQNNITLRLDAGAVLKAAFPTQTEGFDSIEPNAYSQYQDFGHSHWKNSLIWGIRLENITICGQGIIDGQGLTREESHIPGVGNKVISLKLCRNVLLKNVKLERCGHFALLATGVDNMTIDNLLIDTNRDGLDVDACRNVRISNCTVNSPYDDAIVLKATYALGFFRNTENVTISNCFVSGYDLGTVMNGTFQHYQNQAPDQSFSCGRIKLGTESSGGFNNITIANCVFDHCRGLALETVDGGDLHNITVSNIVMKDMNSSPIFIRLGSRMRSPKGTSIGQLHDISINNIRVYNADSHYVCSFSGIPGHPIEDITLSNIAIYYQGEGTKTQASLIVPEKEAAYPEPTMFGELPAAAFYIRHARNIQMNHIAVYYAQPDFRPSVILSDVHDITFDDLRLPKESHVPFFSLHNVTDFNIFHCFGIKDITLPEAEHSIY